VLRAHNRLRLVNGSKKSSVEEVLSILCDIPEDILEVGDDEPFDIKSNNN